MKLRGARKRGDSDRRHSLETPIPIVYTSPRENAKGDEPPARGEGLRNGEASMTFRVDLVPSTGWKAGLHACSL